MIARLALAAALLGSAAGATAVLAAAEDDPPPKPKPPAIAAQATPAQPTPEPLKAEDVRLLVQVPDPEGAAPWAVRHFAAAVKPQLPPKELRDQMPAGALKELKATRTECWELGRIEGEQFGWIDGEGTFTTHAPGHYGVPSNCMPPSRLAKLGSSVFGLGTVTVPPDGAPRPARAITWGPVAEDVVAVTPEGGPRIPVGSEGVVLRVVSGESNRGLRGVIERRDGSTERFDHARSLPNDKRERPLPGTRSVEVRAPDPAGGEPWAVIVHKSSKGGLCYSAPGRLVGTQLGYVDPVLDTFSTTGEFEIGCGLPKPTRAYPLRVTTLRSSIPGGADDRGQIERRTLSNRIVFHGSVHPDVMSVTIRTPRDVRTLVPSPTHHMFIAVYDGQFPGGNATATAHLRNGKEVTRSVYVE
ncbi:hypothetical protein OJ997_35000 [Solirubrobacter phytolaccae]|uniref:Secreted protein n=1 Tax=Solirubrobacter phytolaccae TaxID=1404360 RepID=A0A9X3NG97_9ACTN|nr:hypothetical protein [Solirubrobacter phytolaccae]MDA0185566.1 hypothetical protein [Solirubrobacter phytolaccae]